MIVGVIRNGSCDLDDAPFRVCHRQLRLDIIYVCAKLTTLASAVPEISMGGPKIRILPLDYRHSLPVFHI